MPLAARSDRMKILIIEDEIKLSNILLQGLKEQGMAVDVARDGAAGLASAAAAPYDAIILDVMLPKKNGFQVLQELREAGDKTPVLMLTTRSGVEDRVRGLDLGADDYLPKPFAFQELLARLRAITRRPQVEPQTHAGGPGTESPEAGGEAGRTAPGTDRQGVRPAGIPSAAPGRGRDPGHDPGPGLGRGL
jgi:DNA-binding response OmpR family regulator